MSDQAQFTLGHPTDTLQFILDESSLTKLVDVARKSLEPDARRRPGVANEAQSAIGPAAWPGSVPAAPFEEETNPRWQRPSLTWKPESAAWSRVFSVPKRT